MNKDDLAFEESLNYNELVAYLLAKYGVAKYSYFCKDNCKSKQKKNMRTNEGLFLHHIAEKNHIMLCNSMFAKQWDFEETQSATKLVYCNYLEHLLLHIKITNEYMEHAIMTTKESTGIGGVVNFIGPELSTYYAEPPVGCWQQVMFELVKDNYDDYIRIIAEFEVAHPEFDLSKNIEGKRIKKIRKDIDKVKKEIAIKA